MAPPHRRIRPQSLRLQRPSLRTLFALWSRLPYFSPSAAAFQPTPELFGVGPELRLRYNVRCWLPWVAARVSFDRVGAGGVRSAVKQPRLIPGLRGCSHDRRLQLWGTAQTSEKRWVKCKPEVIVLLQSDPAACRRRDRRPTLGSPDRPMRRAAYGTVLGR